MGNIHSITRAQVAGFVLEHGVPHIHGRVLDAGCGSKPFKEISQHTEWVGLDIRPVGEVQADLAKELPFVDESFDSVVCTDTLQYILEPLGTIRELLRILKPGGILVLTVPVSRMEFGEELWGFRPNGLAHIFRELNAEILVMENNSGIFRQEGQNFLLSTRTGTPMDLGLFWGWVDSLDKRYPNIVGCVVRKPREES